jgi:hypothetical protein
MDFEASTMLDDLPNQVIHGGANNGHASFDQSLVNTQD